MTSQRPGNFAHNQQAYYYGVGMDGQGNDAIRIPSTTTGPLADCGPAWAIGGLEHLANGQTKPPGGGVSMFPASSLPAGMSYSSVTAPYPQQWPDMSQAMDHSAMYQDMSLDVAKDQLAQCLATQMPYRRNSDSQWSQITSANDSVTSSMPEPTSIPRSDPKTKSKARKPSPDTSPLQRPKTWSTRPHSIIEKKYRENLNNKITELHETLVATKRNPALNSSEVASGRLSKSEIISNAVRHINETEVNVRRMEEQIARLMNRVEVLEREAGLID